MSKRSVAKITGWSLIAMAAIAAFSFGYAWPIFFNSADQAVEVLQSNNQLYRYMLMGIVFILLLDLIVSWTLYLFFKQTDQPKALGSFVLRIVYTIVFAAATYQLIGNLGGVDEQAITANYQSFNDIWSLGLIVFGFHLLITAVLMRLHGKIHMVLWLLTLVAGFSYVLVHLLKVAVPDMSDFTSTLEMVLALPMALGELVLAVWLIVRGGKDKSRSVVS